MTDPSVVAVTPWAQRRPTPHTALASHEDRLSQLTPKQYMIGAQLIDLYTVGDLAWMLGRSPVTIRKWERNGILPTTPFKRTSKDMRGSRRLYTRGMILGIVAIAEAEGVLLLFNKHLSKTSFTRHVEALFTSELENRRAA